MFLPPAASSMAPDGKGANYGSIWATAFIINSTDWFLQKSFFNQEFPTPRMASTQINYLRGYLGLKCIKFQFHLSGTAILWITFHTLYFCVLLISWHFWDYCNYWLTWLILNPASSWKNTIWAKKTPPKTYRAHNVGFNLHLIPNAHICSAQPPRRIQEVAVNLIRNKLQNKLSRKGNKISLCCSWYWESFRDCGEYPRFGDKLRRRRRMESCAACTGTRRAIVTRKHRCHL